MGAQRGTFAPVPAELGRADPRIVAIQVQPGEITGDQMQAVEVAERDRALEGDAARAQVGIPQHRRKVERQRRLAELQAGGLAGTPAHEDLVDAEIVAAFVVVVAPVVGIVVAAEGQTRRADEFPGRREQPGQAIAQPTARAVEVVASVRQARYAIMAEPEIAAEADRAGGRLAGAGKDRVGIGFLRRREAGQAAREQGSEAEQGTHANEAGCVHCVLPGGCACVAQLRRRERARPSSAALA